MCYLIAPQFGVGMLSQHINSLMWWAMLMVTSQCRFYAPRVQQSASIDESGRQSETVGWVSGKFWRNLSVRRAAVQSQPTGRRIWSEWWRYQNIIILIQSDILIMIIMLLRCLYSEDAYLSVCIIPIQFDELIFQFWLSSALPLTFPSRALLWCCPWHMRDMRLC